MPAGLSQFLPILLMAGVFGLLIFFSSRTKKRQIAAAQKLQDSIKPGTRVSTTSGLHGTVTAVADDTIELEIAPGVRTTWVRAAVRDIVVPAPDDIDPTTVNDTPADDVVTLDKRSGDLG